MLHIHAKLYHSVLKSNKALKNPIMWMNLENIILTAKPEKKIDSTYQVLRTGNSVETESGVEVSSSWRRGRMEHSCLTVWEFVWQTAEVLEMENIHGACTTL